MRPLALLATLAAAPTLAFADEPTTAEPRAIVPPKLWTDGGRGGIAANSPVTMQSFVKLARSLGPAVVNISTVQGGDPAVAPGHPRTRGQGTGFVIEKTGYILTNNHVVDGAEEIKV